MAVTDGPVLLERIEPHLGWSDRAGDKANLLRTILSSATDPRIPGAIIPIVDGPSLRFLACAGTLAEWERLRPLLLAYVGVTLSDFDGRITRPRPDDSVDELLRAGGIEVIAEVVPRPDAGRQCVDALVSLATTLTAAPPEAEFAPRSTAQLLAAFRMATAAEDRSAAEASIAALRTEMRLDALNLAFLEVQLDAALGDWTRLRNRWFFDQLCSARRPPRVTAALAEALYRCEIEPLQQGLDGAGLVALFHERCLRKFGRLFTVAPSSPSTAVIQTFLLAAAAGAVPDRNLAISMLRAASRPGADEEAASAMAVRLFGDDILLGAVGDATGEDGNQLRGLSGPSSLARRPLWTNCALRFGRRTYSSPSVRRRAWLRPFGASTPTDERPYLPTARRRRSGTTCSPSLAVRPRPRTGCPSWQQHRKCATRQPAGGQRRPRLKSRSRSSSRRLIGRLSSSAHFSVGSRARKSPSTPYSPTS